jgi:hypothetical protein
VLTLFSRPRRLAARRLAVRRLAVEQLEGRDVPSTLDLISMPMPLAPPVGPVAQAPGAMAAPEITDVQQLSEKYCQYTLVIMVADPANNLPGMTVTVSGDGIPGGSGQATFIPQSQSFAITFELPLCTSATTATHCYQIVARGANGQVSERISWRVDQTPQPPPTQ